MGDLITKVVTAYGSTTKILYRFVVLGPVTMRKVTIEPSYTLIKTMSKYPKIDLGVTDLTITHVPLPLGQPRPYWISYVRVTKRAYLNERIIGREVSKF